nr:DUF4838 domain-containing protein [Victivallales bacterium]
MRKFLAGLMLVALSFASFAGEQFIAKDGKSNAQIVIAAENRPRMATFAALELQYFIQKMSGARLPIVTSPDASVPVKIYVGKSPETEKLGIKTDDLKYGAFKIASGADWLALVGDDRDFVPPFEPWPMSRSGVKASEDVWKKRISGVTDCGWIFPFRAGFKNGWNLDNKGVWNQANFEKIMNGRYGDGAVALWMSGGNSTAGFWNEDENGSLNAVHEFLRGLGVRYYMPGEENEIAPKMTSIELPKMEKTVIPDYSLRNWSWYYYGAFSFEDVLWARRLGMNYGYEQTGLVRGPHGLCFVFTGEECKKNHPEYFAIFGGERDFTHKGGGSVCFSSEGLEKETVKYIRFMLDEYKFPLVDIWPIDGLKPCQCEKCRGLSSSEQVWGFVNRVATEVYKTHPDKIVSCGAYTSYIEAPDTIEKFSPNVAVWISNCGRPKMTDTEHWDKYMARINKWQSKLAPGRILRLENSLYHLYKKDTGPMPFPVTHPHGTAKDLK